MANKGDIALLVADIYEAAGALRRRGDAIAATQGQSQARWQVLSVISGANITVSQAARRLGVTRQGVQRIANQLIEEQLVHLAPNPDHRSSPLLCLTQAGEIILGRINGKAQRLHSTIASTLNGRELSQTRESLRAIIEAVAVE